MGPFTMKTSCPKSLTKCSAQAPPLQQLPRLDSYASRATIYEPTEVPTFSSLPSVSYCGCMQCQRPYSDPAYIFAVTSTALVDSYWGDSQTWVSNVDRNQDQCHELKVLWAANRVHVTESDLMRPFHAEVL